ncbi:cytochrome c nitrite reductase small subunit [Formosa sp. A9]|uniref:cytochrome c nitrite reductase small subunit n=1 Tax=Formosa sp. A9 TaxID=3442641 RepID=UPI003EBD9802
MAINLLPDKHSRWLPVAIVILGSIVGLGLFLAKESEVVSYMTDDPKACVNCHVMTSEYNSWMHSSHREVASCNGCHVPHDNIANTYFFKAKDGLYHASVFTMRNEPQVIFMKEASQEVVQQNCIRCHQQQITDTKLTSWVEAHQSNRTDRQCWDCHREVPHGSVHGLSSTKYTIAPIPTDPEKDVIPEWLKEEIKK